MYDVGRLAVKIAGKDAGKTVIIVDKVDDNFVIIDGPIKRKRCNVKHLEPLGEIIKIKKGASSEEVKGLVENKVKFYERKSRKAGEKPRKRRKVKEKKEEPKEEKIKKKIKKEKKVKEKKKEKEK